MVIFGRDHFRRALEQERERADRNAHGFAVVIMDVSPLDDRSFERLLYVLSARTRACDLIGWYKRGRLGVILADCNAQGALTYIRDISAALQRSGLPSPSMRIFAYNSSVKDPPCGFGPTEPTMMASKL